MNVISGINTGYIDSESAEDSETLEELKNLKKNVESNIKTMDEIQSLYKKVQQAHLQWKKELESDVKISNAEDLIGSLNEILSDRQEQSTGAVISKETQRQIQVFEKYFKSDCYKTRCEFDLLYREVQENLNLETAQALLKAMDKIKENLEPDSDNIYLNLETKDLIDQFNESRGWVRPRRQEFMYFPKK